MKISIEGIDGAGKTTIAKLLSNKLSLPYIKFPRYEFIPSIKTHLEGKGLNEKSAFLLFLADIIDGSLDNFVSDRYYYSTIAYSKLDYNYCKNIIELINPQKPDTIIYLDVSIETALDRNKNKLNKMNYDTNLSVLNEAKSRFEKMFKENFFGNWIKIDNNRPIEETLSDIERILKNRGIEISLH